VRRLGRYLAVGVSVAGLIVLIPVALAVAVLIWLGVIRPPSVG
jgi:lipopolysaccharide/colanic/teichoic acid biosynthesis glycosyltransferase